jgi:hypothetical protein
MSYSMVTVLGSEISVHTGFRRNQAQLNGYAGANGVTGMYLGTRGRPIVVTGVFRYTAATYAAARYGLITAIDTLISTYTGIAEDTWIYGFESYANTVLLSIEIERGGNGDKVYHWSGSQCWCRFVANFMQLQ